MKRKIGELRNKPIVEGDKNLVTKDEVHIDELKNNGEGGSGGGEAESNWVSILDTKDTNNPDYNAAIPFIFGGLQDCQYRNGRVLLKDTFFLIGEQEDLEKAHNAIGTSWMWMGSAASKGTEIYMGDLYLIDEWVKVEELIDWYITNIDTINASIEEFFVITENMVRASMRNGNLEEFVTYTL